MMLKTNLEEIDIDDAMEGSDDGSSHDEEGFTSEATGVVIQMTGLIDDEPAAEMSTKSPTQIAGDDRYSVGSTGAMEVTPGFSARLPTATVLAQLDNVRYTTP